MDGAACQGGAVGTPFFLFTAVTIPRGLFANAYAPEAPVTGAANAVDASSAVLSGAVNPEGASVKVSFEFGTTTAYGQTTATQLTGPASTATPFAAQLTGLPAGTTIHYRAVASSDFGTFVGADKTLTTTAVPTTTAAPTTTPAPTTTAAPPEAGTIEGPGRVAPGRVDVISLAASGSTAKVKVRCVGTAGAMCLLTVKLSVVETLRGKRLLAASAVGHKGGAHRGVVIGTARLSLAAGQTRAARIALNRTGRRLVARLHRLSAKLQIGESDLAGGTRTLLSRTVSFTGRPGPSRRAG